MHVLKTTSPLCACFSGAPKRIPSYVAPDSRARRPRTSGTGDLLRRDRHARRVLMDDATARDGEHDHAAKARAEERGVARPRLEWLLTDRPLRVRVEERARRRLADPQTRLGNPGRRSENPVRPNGQTLDER